MKADDWPTFDKAFNRLAGANIIHGIDKPTKDLYFETLFDLPLWAVVNAEGYLRRHPVPFFTLAIWHEKARSIVVEQQRRELAQSASGPRLPEHCAICHDTGWQEIEERMAHCHCRSANPNYLRQSAVKRLAPEQGEPTVDLPQEQTVKRISEVTDLKRLASGE